MKSFFSFKIDKAFEFTRKKAYDSGENFVKRGKIDAIFEEKWAGVAAVSCNCRAIMASGQAVSRGGRSGDRHSCGNAYRAVSEKQEPFGKRNKVCLQKDSSVGSDFAGLWNESAGGD